MWPDDGVTVNDNKLGNALARTWGLSNRQWIEGKTMTEFNYPEPVSQLLALGDIRGQREWPDYLALGLTSDHVPDLIRMVQDEDLHLAMSDTAEVWAPVHAWRALALLQAEDAVKPLIGLFARIDEHQDDWVAEDLPEALGVLGPAAILDLRDYLADASHGQWARVAASASLSKIGTRHPEARTECLAILAGQLEDFGHMDPTLNALVISSLIDLKAVEAASVIRRAFAAKRVDLSVEGDWEDVQISLGLLRERRTPRPRLNFSGLFDSSPSPDEQEQATRKPDKKLGRNDPCWCGSGKKYKHCHMRSDQGR